MSKAVQFLADVCRACCNKIAITDLEEIIRDEMQVFFGQRERVIRHLEQVDQNLTEKTALLDAHLLASPESAGRNDRTHRLYIEEHITPQGFRDFYKPA